MKRTLSYIVGPAHHNVPTVTLGTGLEPGTELTPDALRYLAETFMTIAAEAEAEMQNVGKGHEPKEVFVDFEVDDEQDDAAPVLTPSRSKRAGMTIGGFGTKLGVANKKRP